jgi:hypothetical protein
MSLTGNRGLAVGALDFIVTGAHGRGVVPHLLTGSAAEPVIRTASCPVVAVRHPEHEFFVPDAFAAILKA